MAALSTPLIKSVKKNMKSTEKPITPGEAASLLHSALKYCQDAGLRISGYNEDGYLQLSIQGLRYSNGKVLPVETPTVTPNGVTTTDAVTP